ALTGLDAVVHLAAKVGLGVDVQDLPDYASSNDAGTAALLAAMARAGMQRLTLASSMVVYGEGLGRCADHGAVRPGPRTEAAMSYHNVYGPGMPRDTPYAGVAAIFTSALRRGEAPKVFEDGGQRRDFVHVRDVAAATVAACEQHVDGVRAFNVGSGTPRTVGDMARAL